MQGEPTPTTLIAHTHTHTHTPASRLQETNGDRRTQPGAAQIRGKAATGLKQQTL